MGDMADEAIDNADDAADQYEQDEDRLRVRSFKVGDRVSSHHFRATHEVVAVEGDKVSLCRTWGDGSRLDTASRIEFSVNERHFWVVVGHTFSVGDRVCSSETMLGKRDPTHEVVAVKDDIVTMWRLMGYPGSQVPDPGSDLEFNQTDSHKWTIAG